MTSPAVCSETSHVHPQKEKELFYLPTGDCCDFQGRKGERNSPMVVKHVSSKGCGATESTSGTPASHFFLSPTDSSSEVAGGIMLKYFFFFINYCL